MLFRFEFGFLPGITDAPGAAAAARMRRFLRLPIGQCRTVKVFTLDGISGEQAQLLLDSAILHDPILQRASIGPLPCLEPVPAFLCEVGFRPGVTDNEGRTARDTAALVLNVPRQSIRACVATQYRLIPEPGHDLRYDDVERVCRDLLCNELIEYFQIMTFAQWQERGGFPAHLVQVTAQASSEVHTIDLQALDDAGLEQLSRANTWALNLTEMKTIRDYFANAERQSLGLPPNPTDVELEALAQTWSEHCKHKIFASDITYTDADTGRKENFHNLYKTCIRDVTAIIRKQLGERDYCLSVFTDNAGVINFINGYDLCIKVETHNSPSALDPYGGALTGIVGVNRDPMGTGMGADLICNIDVFCFADPDYQGELPPRILHPRRILDGVRLGVEHGGNKSGIPTVNGSLVFDPRYLGKPLVFCGTVGLIPAEICGHPGYEKAAAVGDIIVMAGGRIGKDGIHGATFSSEELHEGSPATAVQIGDPITQRKLYDFMLRARDKCLYRAITDNGAGGLSSSIGEMAEDCGGAVVDLDKAPLKYDGLLPWEIFLSEAQERMTFAVPPEKLDQFLELARLMDVEATSLGHFSDSGFLDIRYGGKLIGHLAMDFLHHGVPTLKLTARWQAPPFQRITLECPNDSAWHKDFLLAMLGRPNIHSREEIIRQYDHEVKGGSAVKPLTGVLRDGPSDGAVLRPLLASDAGVVIAHGICPRYSDFDAYWMAANAVDEAIRNAVACGADPDALAGVDNFCWPDPIVSANNPDGEYKLAQLVRACLALRHFCLAYSLPCISGKDSMKNDYVQGQQRISIPPTLLFTVMGVIGNVTQAQTSDFKKPGDHIYVLGGTGNELGASEAAAQLGLSGGHIPTVDVPAALARYRAINAVMGQKGISACHDCSDGGLAVALAEMAIGGRLGCKINLDQITTFGKLNTMELLYSESASRHIVTVRPDLAPIMDALGMWQICRHVGEVTDGGSVQLYSGDTLVLDAPVSELVNAFKKNF